MESTYSIRPLQGNPDDPVTRQGDDEGIPGVAHYILRLSGICDGRWWRHSPHALQTGAY